MLGAPKAKCVAFSQFMGIVAAIGPDVRNFRPGDRVVVSCIIACGVCRCMSRLQTAVHERAWVHWVYTLPLHVDAITLSMQVLQER